MATVTVAVAMMVVMVAAAVVEVVATTCSVVTMMMTINSTKVDNDQILISIVHRHTLDEDIKGYSKDASRATQAMILTAIAKLSAWIAHQKLKFMMMEMNQT